MTLITFSNHCTLEMIQKNCIKKQKRWIYDSFVFFRKNEYLVGHFSYQKFYFNKIIMVFNRLNEGQYENTSAIRTRKIMCNIQIGQLNTNQKNPSDI